MALGLDRCDGGGPGVRRKAARPGPSARSAASHRRTGGTASQRPAAHARRRGRGAPLGYVARGPPRGPGARAPEVNWLFPDELRRVARRAPGVAPNPDQMGTALLRAENLSVIPDPLRSQLRTLVALAGGGGGRYALVPAALVYRRPSAPEKASGDTGAEHAPPHTTTADLTMPPA